MSKKKNSHKNNNTEIDGYFKYAYVSMCNILPDYNRITQFLINNLYLTSMVETYYNKTLLIRALECNNLRMVKFLLNQDEIFDNTRINSNPGHVDNNGNTALIIACKNELLINNYDNIVEWIIQNGQSNPGQVNKEGDTALIICCSNNDIYNSAQQIFNTNESNPGHADKNGYTALMHACKNRLEYIASILINSGQSNPGKVSLHADTALILACKQKMENVAIALINTNEAKPHIKNAKGNDALYYARLYGLKKVIYLLEPVGHIIRALNPDAETVDMLVDFTRKTRGRGGKKNNFMHYKKRNTRKHK